MCGQGIIKPNALRIFVLTTDTQMQRLIYTSMARRQMSQRDIDRILMTSRLYNEMTGITGLLVYHEKRFLQVLEGPIGELDKVYDRIRRDWRHKHCRLLLKETIIARAFDQWEMAYRNHDDLIAHQRLQLIDIKELVNSLSNEDLTDNSALYVFLKAFVTSFERLKNAA